MEIDYLSTLNAGSGLNTKEIIDSLVAAESTPQKVQINTRLEERNVSISSLGKIKQRFDSFSKALTPLNGDLGLSTNNLNAVSVRIRDSAITQEDNYAIEVEQLAQSHTLRFDGFASPTDELSSGNITIAFGQWDNATFTRDQESTAHTIQIEENDKTIAAIAEKINAAEIGIEASIIKVEDDNYALILKSEPGAQNNMWLSVSEDAPGLEALDFSTYQADKESTKGQDSIIKFDGTSIQRSSNQISDLIEGIDITLERTSTSAETLKITRDVDRAFSVMQDFVSALNEVATALGEETARGSGGSGDAPLAGDSFTKNLRSQIRSMTTRPLAGFGDEDIFLANFGAQTERDGTITLNEQKFRDQFSRNPQSFAAIVASSAKSNIPAVQPIINGDNFIAGVYDFSLATGEASINGQPIQKIGDAYYSTSGATSGLQIQTSLSSVDTKIYLGRSLLDQMTAFAENLLRSNSEIDQKIETLNNDITAYNIELGEIDIRAANIRERYVTQFTAMESLVRNLQDTGSYLTNFMESWRAGLKR